MKSNHNSFYYDTTTTSFLNKKSRRKLCHGNNKDKLKVYQDVKEQMLGTFYIGTNKVKNIEQQRCS